MLRRAPAALSTSANAKATSSAVLATEKRHRRERASSPSCVGNAALTTPSTGKVVISFATRTELTTGLNTCSPYARPAPAASAKIQISASSLLRLGQTGRTDAVGGSTI